MLEVLAPAGSAESVVAAVQNGADAVYLGFDNFNARRGAKNLTPEEFEQAAEYCRIRNVKVYVTLNTLATDRELPYVVRQAVAASRLGADALIVQDLGVLRAVKQALPEMRIHASTQMSVHNLEGVVMAAAMGAQRVVLARELTKREIAYICKRSPIEIEVFAHGALCVCYSGQCYMSSVIGRRSGNRGLCAQPCRLNYTAANHDSEYLLSLKDNCLIHHLEDLESIGVTSLKIEGRMKRPEYTAIVTGIYSRLVKEGERPTKADYEALKAAFSRQGFTDGYFTGETGAEMFGVHEEDDGHNKTIFATARKNYLNGEFQRVPVRFLGAIKRGEPAKIAVMDDKKNYAMAEGMAPEPAFHKELTPATLSTQLHKTGGTPFYCAAVKSTVEPGLNLPMAAINEMRRSLLAAIIEKRKAFTPGQEREVTFPERVPNKKDLPMLNISVLNAEQLSFDLCKLKPEILYFPLSEMESAGSSLWPFLDDEDINVAVTLPRVIHDNERREIRGMLERAGNLGVTDVLIGNLGHMRFVKNMGFNVRGDFGLNVFNSQTLQTIGEMGIMSATASFELRLEQVRDLSKTIDTELIAYGRLPLMITENCIIKRSTGICSCDNFPGIMDRTGANFPIVKEYGCRNVILNSKKVFLADRLADITSIGLWAVRLAFTTENAAECVSVAKRYLGLGSYEPGGHTRGLYYRGVE